MNARRGLVGVLAAVLALAACGDGDRDDGAGTAGATTIAGLLGITAGTCDGGQLAGSWFRMVQPGGTVTDGPFVANPDSTCADHDVTPLRPGTDGGLRLGAYQPQPEPNFLPDGTSAAAAIIDPQGFFAVRFGVSTNEVDPQTGSSVPAPSAAVDGSTLTVDLRSLAVSWNGQYFNQGAPAPDGTGGAATGTYDATTGAYALDWTTTVAGGPFDGFTGIWHLEGTLTPS